MKKIIFAVVALWGMQQVYAEGGDHTCSLSAQTCPANTLNPGESVCTHHCGANTEKNYAKECDLVGVMDKTKSPQFGKTDQECAEKYQTRKTGV